MSPLEQSLDLLWYCNLIADREKLKSAFDQPADALWTSVISVDELICQLFDDLHAQDVVAAMAVSKMFSRELAERLDALLIDLEAFYARRPRVGSDVSLLDRPEWATVEIQAKAVVELATSEGVKFDRSGPLAKPKFGN